MCELHARPLVRPPKLQDYQVHHQFPQDRVDELQRHGLGRRPAGAPPSAAMERRQLSVPFDSSRSHSDLEEVMVNAHDVRQTNVKTGDSTDYHGKAKSMANKRTTCVTVAREREHDSGWYIGDWQCWHCYNSKRLRSRDDSSVLGYLWILTWWMRVRIYFYTHRLNLHPIRTEPGSSAGFIFYSRVYPKTKKNLERNSNKTWKNPKPEEKPNENPKETHLQNPTGSDSGAIFYLWVRIRVSNSTFIFSRVKFLINQTRLIDIPVQKIQ
jgi:hypothetical protein